MTELSPLSDPRNILSYNREAWNQAVQKQNRWTQPVEPEMIAQARQGQLEIVLTPSKSIPLEWLGKLPERRVLCLASGGGQQAPLLAAAGALVTVLDNSPAQLAQDRLVAEREGLQLETVQGDMRDLSAFTDQSFELIIHPVSNCFVPDILSLWHEAWRVLQPGGELLAGFLNPIALAYDPELEQQGIYQLRYPTPFSALSSLSPGELKRDYLDPGEPLAFGHSLSDQIGGQLAAGFLLKGMYEDGDPSWGAERYLPHSIATRAWKSLG